ncbi:MAG: hypothetical protein P8J69_03780 [Flavobacteriaceae bacterium]|jgi:hypothetical protein|nr:hypothetical protein [Flavobacteriaceae bacterium]
MKISILFLLDFIIKAPIVISQNGIKQLESQRKRYGIWKKNFNNS